MHFVTQVGSGQGAPGSLLTQVLGWIFFSHRTEFANFRQNVTRNLVNQELVLPGV